MKWNNIELPDKNISFNDDDSVIYCGDCREILPELPDKSIDLVLTDPPYNQTDIVWDNFLDWQYLFVEVDRSSSKDASLVMFGKVNLFLKIIPDMGKWKYRMEAIWVKRQPSSLAIRKRLLAYHENIWWFNKNGIYFDVDAIKEKGFPYKGRRTKSGVVDYAKAEYVTRSGGERYPSTVWIIDQPKYSDEATGHPTQKPLEAVSRIIKSTCPTEGLILDPFLGSGTTAVCAKKLGRKCIGIEIEERYCEIAKNRLSQSVMRLDG